MKKGYIKSLDGLRFLAVALVMVDHWSGDGLGFPAAYLGVCMFFVLSGFLITRILLNSKEKDKSLNRGHGFSLRQFYIRRTIRIFPLYYLVLGVLWLINFNPVRDKIAWFATYMSNNYIALNAEWLGKVDHLWSLAVEEQYYLFFPFLLLFIPFGKVKHLLIGMIVFSVGLRAYFYFSNSSWITSYVLMPTCLDAFGVGGILAYVHFYKKEKLQQFFGSFTNLLFAIVAYAFVVVLMQNISVGHNWVSIIFLRFFESVLSLFLIGNLVLPFSKASKNVSSFFEWAPLVYIGKISYGVYIFHNLIYNPYHDKADSFISKVLFKFANLQPVLFDNVVFKIAFLFSVTIAIASISWFTFEKPFNKLKDRFGY